MWGQTGDVAATRGLGFDAVTGDRLLVLLKGIRVIEARVRDVCQIPTDTSPP